MRAGGLHPTGPDETNHFDLGFLGLSPQGSHDPLEGKFQPLNDKLTPVVMKSCVVCHAGPGIFGFQSMFVDHPESPPLSAAKLESQVTPLIERMFKTYAWGLLQGLWETQPVK